MELTILSAVTGLMICWLCSVLWLVGWSLMLGYNPKFRAYLKRRGFNKNSSNEDLGNFNLIEQLIVGFREELIFRLVPILVYSVIIWIAVYKGIATGQAQILLNPCLIALILWSVIEFGRMHGNIFNIFAQGVVGFFFVLLFFYLLSYKLTIGSLSIEVISVKSIFIAYLLCSITHAAVNSTTWVIDKLGQEVR